MMSITKRAVSNKRGFTLLEVSISIAIIAVVFVSLTSLFNMSIGMTDYARKLTKATFLAQDLMTRFELADGFSPGEWDEMELEDEHEGFSFKVETVETAFPLILEVNLTVYFESVLKKHALTVTSYKAVTDIFGEDEAEDEGSQDETSEEGEDGQASKETKEG